MMFKIAIDAMGGDNAPEAIVAGVDIWNFVVLVIFWVTANLVCLNSALAIR
ncbi:hypothetical protein H7R52_12755 [Weissella confusa]|uniref:Phosphate acyltransferase n=1 Tax=Weissella confusa TaxID=1583 RepID=A0A923NII3_WEICO|nr:hypothetical protein [Weissella confusa]